jgi:adenosylmethionine-8-amino-7-oxononanoate aminotransferase
MALGVTSCTEKIMDAYKSADIMKTFFHGHSFTANPIACAAANASFHLLKSSDTQEKISKINQLHLEFYELLKSHQAVENCRVLGTILALDIKTREETSYVNEVRHKLYPYFLERNILLRPLGNVIYILPPYIITEKELKLVYKEVLGLLDSFQ